MTSHFAQGNRRGGFVRSAAALVAVLALALAPLAHAERTRLRPGWNLFSPAQDVEIGRRVSQDAERQLPMLNDARVDDYLNRLGRRLAAHAPGEKYPYQFKAVNDSSINAFALPGGYLYIHRGIIEAADNEAQLAGVMAHEIAHVALRHGTNQASKAYVAQVPLAILGGVLGSDSIGGVLAQLGAGFAANSVLLKYSRDAERQADLLGTQMLYDANYDPRAMVQFFEKLHAQGQRGRMPEFFSSHPRPENRLERVNQEIEKLGGPPRGYRSDSAEFREIQRRVRSLPAAPKSGAPRGDAGQGRPAVPSDRLVAFDHPDLRISHPDNWTAYGQGNTVMLAPDRGLAQDSQGRTALAYGVILNVYEPHTDRQGRVSLEEATDQLIQELRHLNPQMRVMRRHERIRAGGANGLSTLLVNASPVGGREMDWLVTFLRGNELIYFVGVAPEADFGDYERTFDRMLSSIRFRR